VDKRYVQFTIPPALRYHGQLTPYLHSLLDTFAQQDQDSSGQNVRIDLVEPLTPQEERVLILFASGNTKQEIANELYISVNTVKTHLKRAYRKLAIGSRAEARQIARRLHLLQ
jgi:LuxR family transcriptional regulator, maltose regulon positive regulatory protein